VTKDGRIIYLQTSAVPKFNEKKELIGYSGSDVDVTKEFLSKDRIAKQEAKLKTIIEHTDNVFYTYNLDKELTYVSSKSKELLGYKPEELHKKKISSFINKNSARGKKAIQKIEDAFKTGKNQKPYLIEIKNKKQEKMILEVDESPVKNKKGELIGMSGALRDITHRIKAQEAMKKRTKELEKFHKFAVGRELRMIELKNKIKNLEQELEKANTKNK
jgi:two-component system sporulation sensor kinase A